MKYEYNWNAVQRTFMVGQVIKLGVTHRNPLTKQWEKKNLAVQILQAPDDGEDDEASSGGGGYHSH
jgi:hypothetical protein